MFCFLNITDRVLFSKLVSKGTSRAEPSLFSFLNRKESPSRDLTCARIRTQPAADTVQPSFMPYLPIAKRRRGLKPIFISRSSILSTRVFSSIVGHCRALPPAPRKRERMIMGGKFSRDLYFIKGRIIITGGSNEEIRVFYDR